LDINNISYSGSYVDLSFSNNNLFLLDDIVDVYRDKANNNLLDLLDLFLINYNLDHNSGLFK
jgi:hypothetical protein